MSGSDITLAKYFGFCLLCFTFFAFCDGWRAISANQATYAGRSRDAGNRRQSNAIPDELLPRDYLHSVYKFGYCPPEVTVRQYLRSRVNMSTETFKDADVEFLYIVGDLHSTTRYKLQCVVMKTYVPKKYLLVLSRIPIYYCQGQLFIMVFDSVQRLAVHEFYVGQKIKLPADFFFEFYHPTIL